MTAAVIQNPMRWPRNVGCAVETAVDSSIVQWPASPACPHPRPGGGPPTIGAIRIEYSELRTPSSAAPVIAAGPAATPPLASTPITANCDPPENMNRLSTWVCQISRPDATANAPNDSPYAETAS